MPAATSTRLQPPSHYHDDIKYGIELRLVRSSLRQQHKERGWDKAKKRRQGLTLKSRSRSLSVSLSLSPIPLPSLSLSHSDCSSRVQERGDIFFFYRPKVEREEAHDPDDVQRLYIVLRPQFTERAGEEREKAEEEGKERESGHGEEAESSEPQKVNAGNELLHRFIVMGRKSLPDPSKHGAPFWGFVEMVTKDHEELKTALSGGRSGDVD